MFCCPWQGKCGFCATCRGGFTGLLPTRGGVVIQGSRGRAGWVRVGEMRQVASVHLSDGSIAVADATAGGRDGAPRASEASLSARRPGGYAEPRSFPRACRPGIPLALNSLHYLAPCARNSLTTSAWPFAAAQRSGVLPSPSFALTSAPAASSWRTMSAWPFWAATCSGVQP